MNWKKSCSFLYNIYNSVCCINTIRIQPGTSVYDYAPFIENVCTVPVFLVFQVFHRVSDCWVRFCVCGSRLLQLHTKLRPCGETFWAAWRWWRPQKLLGNYQCWFDIKMMGWLLYNMFLKAFVLLRVNTRVSHFYTFFELSLVLLTTQAHGL